MRVGFDHSEERSIGKLRLRNPAPKLNAIIKPMLTINFADDSINPPELLHLPTASNYTEVMFPAGPASYGHMTLAHPAVWASALGSSCSASRTSADERSDRPSLLFGVSQGECGGVHPGRLHGVQPNRAASRR
jgi:hypothetical protein